VYSLASFFQFDPLLAVCLARLRSYSLFRGSVQSAVIAFVHVARNPAPHGLSQVIEEFFACLLVNGYKEPTLLAKLPFYILQRVLIHGHFLLEGGEFDRFSLLQQVIRGMTTVKDEPLEGEASAAKRAKHTHEDSTSDALSGGLAGFWRFEFFTCKQLKSLQDSLFYGDVVNKAVWQKDMIHVLLTEAKWGDVSSFKGYRHCLKIKDPRTAAATDPPALRSFGVPLGVPLTEPSAPRRVAGIAFDAYGSSWKVWITCTNSHRWDSYDLFVVRDAPSQASEFYDRVPKRRFSINFAILKSSKQPVAMQIVDDFIVNRCSSKGFRIQEGITEECVMDGHIFVSLELCPDIS